MYFLIGHRGVGKTGIVKSLEGGFDLDEEISKEHDINDIFLKGQEKKFREIECKTLLESLRLLNPKIIALGAGFEFDKFDFPEKAKFIWLQRKSDQIGRVFLDRPRLDLDKSQMQEFADRKEKRDKPYKKYADFSIEVEEGADTNKVIKNLIENKLYSGDHGFYTLNKESENSFVKANVELRTDYFSESEIQNICEQNKKNKKLISLRQEPTEKFINFLTICENLIVDVPVEYAEKGYLEKLNIESVFISEHDFISLKEIKEFNKKGFHVKWAPEVESFEELIEHHRSLKNLDVSFLPRSVGSLSGRWNWYRQITFFKNKITFFRYGFNNYSDQPCHYELETLNKETNLYGAVVGGDVSLSHSPSYHREFMNKKFQGTYLRISLYPDEFLKDNLLFLKSLGVCFFSISSPFKDELSKICNTKGPMNTLCIGEVFKTINTDAFSIDFLSEKLSGAKAVLVWGAGAIGKAIAQKIGSRAQVQSIRNYDETAQFDQDFDALVWSAGSDCLVRPRLESPPSLIFDIEYKEHSQAKEVALSWSSEYVSGKDFFVTQAKAQQDFWLGCKLNSPKGN